MARRRRATDPESTRLLDLWSPGEDFGAPIGCVATTFTLDAGHFEEQCLARFVAMETSPAESARAYLIEREEKLSQVFACVLVDQRHAKDQRSLRWHLLPVRLPGAGIQHAKLSLLLWERRLRIVIGSANLTAPGYRSNLEVASCLEFAPDGGLPLALARECLDFLRNLSAFAPGSGMTPGPRTALAAFLADVRQRIRDWTDSPPPPGSSQPALVPVLPARTGRVRSVLAQLGELWRGPKATNATIVSPFFDQTDAAVDFVYRELVQRITPQGKRTVDFWTSGRRLADGQVEIDIPERLFNSPLKHQSTHHELGLVEPLSDADGDAQRPLHAKFFYLERSDFALFMQGSSNFTVKGLGLDAQPNCELNLVYVLPSAAHTFRQRCIDALPDAEDPSDAKKLLFTAATESSQGETAEVALLPAGFEEALFEPAATGGDLRLHLSPSALPRRFEVRLPTGETILTADTWAAEHGQRPEVIRPVDRPVSGLTVRWQADDGAWLAAAWVVNVTDTGLLAPPSELNNLDLEDLLAVLTSARPTHWLLADRIAEKQSRQQNGFQVIVDPHKKVDTSQFLMRRMRRLARALEGLRTRLEQPVAAIEGLRWRLHGPFGPVALGRALKGQAGLGAPFFIAEVASTLKDIRWHANSSVRAEERDAAVQEALRELKVLAIEDAGNTPDNLRDYVTQQLAEICA